MTIVTLRSYPHTSYAPHLRSTLWSHCGSFRVLNCDNINYNEDRISITLIDSVQSHRRMNCQILNLYELYFFHCTLHVYETFEVHLALMFFGCAPHVSRNLSAAQYLEKFNIESCLSPRDLG